MFFFFMGVQYYDVLNFEVKEIVWKFIFYVVVKSLVFGEVVFIDDMFKYVSMLIIVRGILNL